MYVFKVVFIDHASYGRPFWLETAGVSPTFCPEESFAGTEKSYCVASNTLAAVLYWCQGKEGCEVDPVCRHISISSISSFQPDFRNRNRRTLKR